MSTSSNEPLTPDNIVAFIADVFERRGGEEYLGEPVTMAQHMLQAATFAEQADMEEDIIVGALLHDIGHFTSEFGTFSMTDTEDRFHEEAGADVLAAFFPPVIIDCVRHHVAAKRYLCATRPSYFNELSEASVHSLNLQGGPMNDGEINEFAKNTNLEKILQVRLLDDSGKLAGIHTPEFAHFAPLVQKLVDIHSSRKP